MQQQSTSIHVAIWHINKQMQGTEMISTSLAKDAVGGKLELYYSGLQIIFKRYMHKNCLESQYITPIFMYLQINIIQLGG